MPGPSPGDFDSQTTFMRECVPFYVNEGREQGQAVAICLSEWQRGKQDQFVTPDNGLTVEDVKRRVAELKHSEDQGAVDSPQDSRR